MTEKSEYAVKNIPGSAYVILGLCYLALMLAIALVSVGDGISRFIWLIATLGATPLFILPAMMFKRDPNYENSTMLEFIEEGINTESGHCSGGAALVQMLVVPVCATIGVLLIALLA